MATKKPAIEARIGHTQGIDDVIKPIATLVKKAVVKRAAQKSGGKMSKTDIKKLKGEIMEHNIGLGKSKKEAKATTKVVVKQHKTQYNRFGSKGSYK
jgi:hypothetical protein